MTPIFKTLACQLCEGKAYLTDTGHYYCERCGLIYKAEQDIPNDEVIETD